LEGVNQFDLETVVPTKGNIKVVRGKYCGELGTVYEKDLKKGVVYVQLDDNMDVYEMQYDDVAEYRV